MTPTAQAGPPSRPGESRGGTDDGCLVNNEDATSISLPHTFSARTRGTTALIPIRTSFHRDSDRPSNQRAKDPEPVCDLAGCADRVEDSCGVSCVIPGSWPSC